ncbi:MAG: family 16 glycoside hydrolase [Bacteroidota bacterium]
MNRRLYTRFYVALVLVNILGIGAMKAQSLKTKVLLDDFSAFKTPAKNWKLVGGVHADPYQAVDFTIVKGSGILVNQFDKGKAGEDLTFTFEHGDIDVEMDYMVGKGTNSGIFLQGRYEVQLSDSWGVTIPKSGDNGGINERWDDTKPNGEQGYEGHAPRQNVSKAPGLWQHIKISFQAPKFNDKGLKSSNAKILYVWLNDVLIHENVELFGTTRNAKDKNEAAVGLLSLHSGGAIAFKNISYTNFNKPHPNITQLKYAVYKGNFSEEPDYKILKTVGEGSPSVLTSNEVKVDNEFALKYTGILHIQEPGEYAFKLSVPGGKGTLKVNGIKAVDAKGFTGDGTIELPKGDLPIELFYTKNVDWAKAALGLTVSGPGIREHLLSDANVSTLEAIDKIQISATENKILRSFSDLPGNIRVTHGVSVGSPTQLHYSYDLDNGMIVQVWRGEFLDATPMWHERGDGSSSPTGAVQFLGKPAPGISKLANTDAAWVIDTIGTYFKSKGYKLTKERFPVFQYLIYGSQVNDASTILPEGKGIRRELNLDAAIPNAFVRMATGNKIDLIKQGMYCVDDSYYISVADEVNEKPIVRLSGSLKELIIPIKQKLTYSIIL